MFGRHHPLLAVHGAAAAICLALLAGCIPHTVRVAPAPANLVATGGVGSISLTWNASAGASGYNVKRSSSGGGPYTQLASTASPGYTDSSVAVGTVYYYVVSALAPDGESADSKPASATTAVTPLTPGNIVATAGDRQATLTWSASSGATGYHLKRASTAGGPYTQIAAPTSTSYTDTALTNGTVYYYVVSAFNAAGESPNSTATSVVPDVQNPPPTTFGTWINVTPSNVDLTSGLCSNYGATTVQVDPAHSSNLYTLFHCQGIWKSTDYGATWTGPINTGTNGAMATTCSGGITIAPGSTAGIPTIYAACIRGGTTGFLKSVDGGVSWTQYVIAATTRQDYYPPVVDPYDVNHLLMTGHEFSSEAEAVVESVDGGQNWTHVPIAAGMVQDGHSPYVFFINTGNAASTRGTWLLLGEASGGGVGTWRTTDSGAGWVRVDDNEHQADTQIYQPDSNGVVYMAGTSGVVRSRDYGQTWTRVGLNFTEAVVFGTSKNVYAMYGFPVGPGGATNPAFQVGSQPGTGTWVAPGTPGALAQGPAQVTVINDGTRNILLGAMRNSGMWRYVEP